MLIELVISILAILETASSQYPPAFANQYYQSMPNYYQNQPEPQVPDYEDKRSSYASYNKDGNSGGVSNDYESGSDECKCSCAECKDSFRPVKSCCREFCYRCPADPVYSPGPMYNIPVPGHSSALYNMPGSGQNPGNNVVFVPYPYPMMLPNTTKNVTTSTTSTTSTTTTMATTTKVTTEATTKATPPTKVNLELQSNSGVNHRFHTKAFKKTSMETNDYMKLPKGLREDRKYMVTNLRKVKPTWEPKYGIVPIPDILAEKLMSQLREVKELQHRRF